MATATQKFPSQIKYIVGNEGCERYSYYGMRSILTVFMVNVLMFNGDYATEVMHIFMGACYLFPVAGAYIADRLWGRYNTILYLSLFYCAGHAVLAMYENKYGLYAGLTLIALGAGGIKPCISAFVGDQFRSDQKDLVSKVYSLFYWMINFGSTFSTIITPLTLKYYGPSVAFGIPGVLMAIATLIFWLGTPHYVKAPPSGHDPHSVWKILGTGLLGLVTFRGFFTAIKDRHPAPRVEEFKIAMSIAKIFAMVSVFWALFDQHASTWVLQAEKMNGHVDLGFISFDILSSQVSSINPIFVLTLIPVFVGFVYPTVNRFYEMTPLRKMAWGMVFASFGFVAVALIQYQMDQGIQMHMAWQAIPYLIMTIAEVMISITGLEFAYTQAPKQLKSTIMSFWLLTVFIGNVITAFLVHLSLFPLGTAGFFLQFGAMMLLAAGVFALIIRSYKMRYFFQE